MASLHPTLDEIAGHGIAFVDLCAEMREIVKSKWRRTDLPPQNLPVSYTHLTLPTICSV